MKDLIEPYLEAHETAWAESTYKSEKSRLNSISDRLDLTPKDLYQVLLKEGYKLYSIKTLFIRLSRIEKWGGLKPNFGQFLETHRNRFKHAYEKETLEINFNECSNLLNSVEYPEVRVLANGLLKTGLRISEAYRVKDGQVIGKGGKPRKVYGRIEARVSQSTLRRKLKAVGLKPHMLRKLCATRLAEKGATPADLCKIFGWSSIKTAYQYLQPREDEKIEALMAEGQEGP